MQDTLNYRTCNPILRENSVCNNPVSNAAPAAVECGVTLNYFCGTFIGTIRPKDSGAQQKATVFQHQLA